MTEMAATAKEIVSGNMPERPFILLAQQYLADPRRSKGNVHPIWTYAQVPHGYPGDATDAIISQIERFAPGVRERIVASSARAPAELASRNANYVGGNIAIGANSMRQLVFRPRPALNPYRTGVPGVYLCSAATPPGPAVHGMCGYQAARAALADL